VFFLSHIRTISYFILYYVWCDGRLYIGYKFGFESPVGVRKSGILWSLYARRVRRSRLNYSPRSKRLDVNHVSLRARCHSESRSIVFLFLLLFVSWLYHNNTIAIIIPKCNKTRLQYNTIV